MSGHTPGPWYADEKYVTTGGRAKGDNVVATAHDVDGSLRENNARLIASAPTLYDFAKEVAEHLYDPQDYARIRESARAAIRKAEGGSDAND